MRKVWKRLLTGLLVTGMLLTPVSGTGITVANAEGLLIAPNPNAGQVHVLDATALDATGVADKDALAEGTTYDDGYFKIVGEVTQRTNSDGTMKALEIAKNLKGAIEFTVAGTADVALVVSSTGGSNTSAVALVDAGGALVTNNEGLAEVSTTAATTLTYTALAAGTYRLVSPESDYNRGYRVLSVTVRETGAAAPEVGDENGVPVDSMFMYNFSDGSVISAAYTADAPLKGVLTSEDGFLTINGNNAVYDSNSKKGAVFSNGDSIEVKVAGDAIVSFVVSESSTAGSEWQASAGKGALDVKVRSAVAADYDGQIAVFRYEGVATTLVFTANTSGTIYLHGVNVVNLPEASDTPAAVGNGKIDVWDFGLEEFDPEKYNNMLTADEVNSWYGADVEPGSSGVNLKSFATEDIFFCTGNAINSRYRTANTAVTRYDEKTKKYTAEDGTQSVLNGLIYSNSSATALINMGIRLYEGDILTLYLSSNSGTATVYVESPGGEIVKVTTSSDASVATKQVICAGETGIYRMYTLDEKLVVCRLEREHTAPVLVSGQVTAPDALTGYQLVFTNKQTGARTAVSPAADGKYEVWLRNSYDYTLSLENANGYMVDGTGEIAIDVKASGGTYTVVKGDMLRKIARKYGCTIWDLVALNPEIKNPDLILIGQKLILPGGSGSALKETVNVKIGSVDLVTLSGKITGLTEEALKSLKLSFVNADYAYIPELTVSGDSVTARLERGVTYEIVAEGVNDYSLSAFTTVSLEESREQNIEFSAKPLHEVTFITEGIDAATWANAEVTFTNINESGYAYTFKPAAEKVLLRDGQYSVRVSGVGSSVAQKLTANVKVNGAAAAATIKFETLTSWDFARLNQEFGGAGVETIAEGKYYSGLILTGSVKENKTYLLANAEDTVQVPVKAGQVVTVSYCYSAAFNINGDAATAVDEKSGSTSKISSVSYTAAEDGYVTIHAVAGANATQTYFTGIAVSTPVAYQEVITVGADKDYQTITGALNAIAMMDRAENERVTVMIDPGNYEEMLVISQPDITLKNAAGDAASLELTNKGVDIAENAVRITSYYGYGYSYYSMGADTRYDAELLEVNKANGSHTYENKGGTTDGSYWNATVVVYADGFEAEGIIFENSFNQYISGKEANDILVRTAGNLPDRPVTAGDTSVQDYTFKHQAAALAMANEVSGAYFNHCKFVGRQDVVYGGTGVAAAFYQCDILGSTDYIMGGMTAVFIECRLVMNTSDHKNDAAHLTAPQQSGGRGYLFWDCAVTSTTPGVDTASAYISKPGTFGRPWKANTSEAVFVNTTIEATDAQYGGGSLIQAEGWNSGLSGESAGMQEYNTIEKSGVDNREGRADWATVLTEPKLNDGTDISTREKAVAAFLGGWNPFEAKAE